MTETLFTKDMTTTKTNFHPELLATAMDLFASQVEPLPTSTWSIKLTESMRRNARTHGIPESDIMPVTAGTGAYREVPGSWIPRIAKAIGAVSVGKMFTKGRTQEHHWATPEVIDRWNIAREAKAALVANVAERVEVRESWTVDDRYVVRVITDGRLDAEFTLKERTGWQDGEPVYAERLTRELAIELAEHTARKVRHAITQAVMA